jgi:hypothetical protein
LWQCHTQPNGDTYRFSYTYSYSYANTDYDSYSYPNGDTDSNGKTYSYSKVYSHAERAPNSKAQAVILNRRRGGSRRIAASPIRRFVLLTIRGFNLVTKALADNSRQTSCPG